MTKKHPRNAMTMTGTSILGFCLATGLATSARADYPIMSHRYLADPGFLVFKDRIYLYNSNDDDNNGSYQMKSIVAVSTTDLKNWTDHGIVFQVPADASWAGFSWAPQPIHRDGTIYMYFGNNASGVGVATSKDPAGRFKDGKGSALVNGSTPGASGTNMWLFDPGAMIDEDGSAYLAFGGNGEANARIIKLGDNLTSVSGSATQMTVKAFFEASFLFKRNKIYYFAYSTNSSNGQRIDYLMSNSPMSGYTYAGVIGDQPPNNGNNNHASEFEYKGVWYHAYHNRIVAKNEGVDPGFKRNLGMEVLNFNADGTIKKVVYTADGLTQLAPMNPYVRQEAETMNAQKGIETEVCTAGGMDVTSIAAGDWIKVRGVDFGSVGAKSFTARVAAASAGGGIEIRLGSDTGTVIGTCPVPSTGGAQTWANATCTVTGATGVKDVVFKFTGGNFNFDYWQFATDGPIPDAGAVSTGGTTATGGSQADAGAPRSDASTGGIPATGGISATGGARTGGILATGGSTSPGTGGRTVTGGIASTGGTSTATGSGGMASTGGMSTSTGGTNATGGLMASGGSNATGGTRTGGTTTTTNSSGGCSFAGGERSVGFRGWALAMAGLAALLVRRRRTREGASKTGRP